jgi:hypothetical protein
MAGYRGTHPRYAAMVEQWEKDNENFHEYPMMIYPGDAKSGPNPDPRVPVYLQPEDKGYKPGALKYQGVTVNNEEELAKVIEGGNVTRSQDGLARATTEADERDALLQEAANIGLALDRRWSISRMTDAIAAKKAESKKPTAEVV